MKRFVSKQINELIPFEFNKIKLEAISHWYASTNDKKIFPFHLYDEKDLQCTVYSIMNK